ncbi:MAG: hypothetical protein R6V58_13260 [Planctomycetota bacterium]
MQGVVLADQEKVIWAEDFDTALRKLLGEAAAPEERPPPDEQERPAVVKAVEEWIAKAKAKFDEFEKRIADGDFAGAGKAFGELKELLNNPPTQEQ